jgi:hypothetical protein
MSAGSEMLNAGWLALLDHHATTISYVPKAGGGSVYLLEALVSKPQDIGNFGRNNAGVSYLIFVTAGAVPYAVDDTVNMDGVSYRVLQVDRQPADISIRLTLGVTSIAGKQ